MSAVVALARAEAAGLRLHLRPDGGVRMEAAGPPPADVLADLRRWRDDVARLLWTRAAVRMAAPAVAWHAMPYGAERGEAFAAARLARGACRRCAGRRWWQEARDPTGWRCWACHPGDHLGEAERREAGMRDEQEPPSPRA